MSDYEKLAIELQGEPIDKNAIQRWMSEFAYEGFDAANIVKLVHERAKAAGRDWKLDVKKMIVLALTRGNKVDKMIKKMSEKGAATVTELVRVYSLKSGNPTRDDLTLSRVAAAFAGYTCQALPHLAEAIPVSGSQMDEVVKNYPRPMMHPAFSGLIDPTFKEETKDALINAHSLFMYHFTVQINEKMRGKSDKEIISSFQQPMYAAINSGFMKGETRRAMLRTLGIVDANWVPSSIVQEAAKIYKEKYND
ncbi:nucleocapsid protein [Tapara virus]|uniref:Nucleoprotein n=1 Tax=Tapara virus TaxID=1926501 RepID=A0A1S5SHW4_9VIRU|nr:nucleocapsid protein [Tapara virus]API68895.1 nucleocapsid protein [Tapara virus]